MSLAPGATAGTADTGNPNLLTCNTCGRHFVAEALARHEPICKKVFNKKRKPFNSLKQRLQGTDIPTVKMKPPPKSQPEKKSNWRQQHENFIAAIRSAKLASIAMKEGRPLPPPPPPTINPDYIQCPYCLRRFNEHAAERHINFCKEQAARRSFAPGQKGAKTPSSSFCIFVLPIADFPGKTSNPKKGTNLNKCCGKPASKQITAWQHKSKSNCNRKCYGTFCGSTTKTHTCFCWEGVRGSITRQKIEQHATQAVEQQPLLFSALPLEKPSRQIHGYIHHHHTSHETDTTNQDYAIIK
ncbi:hypothetical protein lerEdw1_018070 [Lerista edwardsae]|nr:hypothetical protein lerEdw1_018070 [Lerista edwardsae]